MGANEFLIKYNKFIDLGEATIRLREDWGFYQKKLNTTTSHPDLGETQSLVPQGHHADLGDFSFCKSGRNRQNDKILKMFGRTTDRH
jgi:hypothetical protein